MQHRTHYTTMKRAMTLMEIMIVILIIGIVGSVIGYNMRGSLGEGKAFKTREGISKVYDILQLEMAKGATAEEIAERPVHYLKMSGIARKPAELIKDGWGNPYEISVMSDGDIEVRSATYEDYCEKKEKPVEYPFRLKENVGSHNCRVCGHYNDIYPWGKDGLLPSFETCDCCGVKFGSENDSYKEGVKRYRAKWIADGSKWHDSRKEPTSWSLEAQLKQVPDPYKPF